MKKLVLMTASFILSAPGISHAGAYTFTAIDGPGASYTEADGINDAGQIVDTGTQGFLDVGGTFTTIDVPGAGNTVPLGINNTGQIVGVIPMQPATMDF